MSLNALSRVTALSRVLIYPQDPQVGPVIEDTVDVAKIGNRLEGPRIGIWDETAMKASADNQGNFLINPERKQFDQVQAFVSSQKTLDLFESLVGRPLPWAFESAQLGVGPHAGEGVNAYYQRFSESLSFYYFDSKALGKTVQTARSADVVSHETGHAILDGLKPEYGHTFDPETKGFHEAFGDCAAMLLTLSRPANRETILRQTGGDLSQENCLSRMGEEFGKAVRLLNHDPGDDRDYLRTALNDFKYVDPGSLPKDGPRETLSAEAHSFCQIWTAAFYRVIANVYNDLRQAMPPDKALEESGQVAGKLLTTGLQMISPARARYADMAAAMLRADQFLNEGKNRPALEKAFADTNLPTATPPPAELRWSTPITDLNSAQQFLADHGPALDVDPGHYTGFHVQRDDRGLTYVEYLDKETHSFGRFASEVRSGLTLTFDGQGRLAHLTRDPVTAEVLRLEQVGMSQEMGQRTSAADLPPTWRVAGRMASGASLVERLPTFID